MKKQYDVIVEENKELMTTSPEDIIDIENKVEITTNSKELTLKEQVQQWIEYDINHDTKRYIQDLYIKNKWEELKKQFIPRINFGTAGLRAYMGPGYHNINEQIIIQSSQGLSLWVEENVQNAKERGIIIGYDGRYNSKLYAELTASVFLYKGYKVYLFNNIVGTPLVPYGVLLKKCSVGIMITASHNIKDDNGYKVYWENGAQIIQPNDTGISLRIQENLVPWKDYKIFDKNNINLFDESEYIISSYMNDITKNYNYYPKENSIEPYINITYTAMHGVGAKFVKEAFKKYGQLPYISTIEQIEPDPEFPTVKFPNPEEGKGALKLAMETADKNNSTLILANDPDADRLAVACKDKDNKWVILTGNEIAAIFAEWVWLQWKLKNPNGDPSKCAMVVSTVSSKHLQSMAKKEGFQFFDTLTGFKWIGNKAIDVTKQGLEFLFGYEVEIGFLVGSVSFDKDGIRTAAIFAEAANYWLRTNGHTVLDRINLFYKRYGYFKMINSYFIYNDMSIGDKIFHTICTQNNGTYPKYCGNFLIKSIRNISTNYDSSYPDMKSRLPMVTDAHMITFIFDNDVTVTLRNSGTEPKLKYYVEAHSFESPEKAEELMKKVAEAVIDNFIRPEYYGLVARKVE